MKIFTLLLHTDDSLSFLLGLSSNTLVTLNFMVFLQLLNILQYFHHRSTLSLVCFQLLLTPLKLILIISSYFKGLETVHFFVFFF